MPDLTYQIQPKCGEKILVWTGTPTDPKPVIVTTQCGQPGDYPEQEWINATECLKCKKEGKL